METEHPAPQPDQLSPHDSDDGMDVENHGVKRDGMESRTVSIGHRTLFATMLPRCIT